VFTGGQLPDDLTGSSSLAITGPRSKRKYNNVDQSEHGGTDGAGSATTARRQAQR
jgi:hypothetical protein